MSRIIERQPYQDVGVDGRVRIPDRSSTRTLLDRIAHRRPVPQDLLIQEVDGNAVVTFLLGSETAPAAYVVLRCVGAEWKIVHRHGSSSGNQP
jgi:hypothetical protein